MEPKEIISLFLHVDPEAINSNTIINRNALKSSIHLHKLYAKLADAGFVINDYSNINTYGELEDILHGEPGRNKPTNSTKMLQSPVFAKGGVNSAEIGIDIEDIASLPKTNDFRADGFYIENFHDKEIAYCILQSDPYVSFAGLFAAKEAIVKANNSYLNVKFKDIIITHDANGKPHFEGASISISHTREIAIAIALFN